MSKQKSRLRVWLSERRSVFAQTLAALVLLTVVAVIVGAFIKGWRKPAPVRPAPPPPHLAERVTSVINGYEFLKTEHGKPQYRLSAARETTYADGRHELEKLMLIAFENDGHEKAKIVAERGAYQYEAKQVEFAGKVHLTTLTGLEVTSEVLRYDQTAGIASTDKPMQFRQGDVNGAATGATVYSKERVVDLLKDARIVKLHPEQDQAGPPVEISGASASYRENEGLFRFVTAVQVTHGTQLARTDQLHGFFVVQTPSPTPTPSAQNPFTAAHRKLVRLELRGNAYLKEQTPQRTTELTARDMDFFFDDKQRLTRSVATGAAKAQSLEKAAPSELRAERLEAVYAPARQGSELQTVTTQGRTTLKIVAPDAAKQLASERVLEADAVTTTLHPGGKFLSRAEANGNAVLTITPLQATPQAERRKLQARKFDAAFFATGNAINTFVADGEAVAEFELLQAPVAKDASNDKARKAGKRVLRGERMNANFQEQTQDIIELTAEGEVKYNDADRHALAARGVYTAATQTVALRGKPQLWDDDLRANADEIDTLLDAGESRLRGKVRTTYFSRATTGGAAPFKAGKAPVTIASDTAVVRHQEGAARYLGNARAWQDDDFVRADNLELDKGEQRLDAWGSVQSAFYRVERESAPNAKPEIVPIFVSADKLVYTGQERKTHYEGKVKIRQGTDQIDAAVADVLMDEAHKLSQLTAAQNVVLTQPQRRGTGDLLVYTAATDTAVLSGNLAQIKDREREATTKGPRLTLFLRDARIEAVDEGGSKRIRTTHRMQTKQ